MENFQYICQQYAQIVNGKPKIKDGSIEHPITFAQKFANAFSVL
ncbi:hypothetical protein [Virgibacillus halodenitrificans]|nr:hypothetical protein [Virgibacillus halodenitrificans]